MVLASQTFGMAVRLISVVAPVGLYFLILGLLNSRRRPQLLSGRQDFALLVVALAPLFVLPLVATMGPSPWVLLALGAALGGVVLVLSPTNGAWVVYNLPRENVRSAVERSLTGLGLDFVRRDNGYDLAGAGAFLRISEFPLLRNVSVRLQGGDPELAQRVERGLARSLGRCRAETSPMAVALLLVATAMLMAPLTLLARHVPEMVRLLTDLMH